MDLAMVVTSCKLARYFCDGFNHHFMCSVSSDAFQLPLNAAYLQFCI